jgi:uncharacterized protein (TIGR02421 family)
VTSTTTLSADDLAIDRELARVSDSYRFLLDLTPVDVEANRDAFLYGGATKPSFTYRELEDELAVMRTVLDSVMVADIEDPTFGHLLRAKHREIELQLDMLGARDTDDFLPLSIELYGAVAPGLFDHAESLLERIDAPDATRDGRRISADRFVMLAEAELAHYRRVDPDIGVHVEIRPDASGILVSGGDLIVGAAARLPADRADALLQHEIGTHLLTYVNGTYQPIRVMAAGLAGYEETQEGLAILAEYLVGGLSPERLRQLAGRVVAVHDMVTGASFAEVYERLVTAGFSRSGAFTTTMRAFRSGGLTKDAIYLRGLLDLLAHLTRGGTLDLLWLGKLSLTDLPLVGELADRGLLREPKLLPRYLADPATSARLEHAAGLTDPAELIGTTR